MIHASPERRRDRGTTGLIAALALALDRALGEPPLRVHPVVAMGRYLDWSGRLRARTPGRVPALAVGGLAWCAGAAGSAAAAVALRGAGRRLPAAVGVPLSAVGLWTLLSLRVLLEEVEGVERALAAGIAPGRAAVARIVGRPVGDLDAAEVREAALESLAENLSDALVAPLLWFAALGLPGAAVYRFANTADAVWGHRGELEWWGKPAARADDLLNLAPARLTALLLAGGRPPRGLREEARRTASPNAGWPMAALALRLSVRLGKRGAYALNAAAAAPGPADADRALALARRAGWAGGLLLAALAWRRDRA
jgi:adenosylcobinamide-phosphate synthase